MLTLGLLGVAKDFSSPLSSFALVPNTKAHPLTSNVMVVNKEGDLEVYAVHDTPNHSRWSHQGDLTIAIGNSYRVLTGFSSKERGPEPWDVPNLSMASRAASTGKSPDVNNPEKHTGASGHSVPTRGRSQSMISPPTFGRGDEDGFPALNAAVAHHGLDSPASGHKSRSATRNAIKEDAKHRLTNSNRNASFSRTLSSLMMRDRSSEPGISPLVDSPIAKDPEVRAFSSADKLALPRSSSRHKRHSNSRSKQPATLHKMQHVMQGDISMIMRRRALKGYGLGNVANLVNINTFTSLTRTV